MINGSSRARTTGCLIRAAALVSIRNCAISATPPPAAPSRPARPVPRRPATAPAGPAPSRWQHAAAPRAPYPTPHWYAAHVARPRATHRPDRSTISSHHTTHRYTSDSASIYVAGGPHRLHIPAHPGPSAPDLEIKHHSLQTIST